MAKNSKKFTGVPPFILESLQKWSPSRWRTPSEISLKKKDPHAKKKKQLKIHLQIQDLEMIGMNKRAFWEP
jgi:hypothetical protein